MHFSPFCDKKGEDVSCFPSSLSHTRDSNTPFKIVGLNLNIHVPSDRLMKGGEGYNFLTKQQYYTGSCLILLSSALSLVGSFLIVYIILRGTSERLRSFYHRLVIGLSVMDILFSVDMAFQPFLMRSDAGFALGMGNSATCSLAGFFWLFFIGGTLYNMYMSIYFLAVTKYRVPEGTVTKWMEPTIHIVAFLIPTSFGILNIVYDNFSPSLYTSVCEFGSYPAACGSNPDEQCERGADARRTGVDLGNQLGFPYVALYLLTATTGIACTWVVWRTFQLQVKRIQRYNIERRMSDTSRRNIEEMTWRAIWFTAAYLPSYFTMLSQGISRPVIGDTLEKRKEPWFLAIYFITCVVFPIQGFLNFLAFCWPRYIQRRRKDPDKSIWWAARHMLEEFEEGTESS